MLPVSYALCMLMYFSLVVGLKVFKCSQCGKPFSVADAETDDEVQLCVFCRLQVVQERDANISRTDH